MILVSDTSVLIDLERGRLLEAVFSLPHGFAVPDVLYRREMAGEWGEHLVALGLRIEEVSEEWAAEEEPDLSYELPMEEVAEEPPYEEDVDHEAIRTVKPLGPAGAKAEDIETEPLEMDL